ncbi:hypothetical protein AWJ20_126 [Sugiyamaella lignohabitans]|uniref:Ell binding protein Ebp1 C-terminal domain-containing protein n=1 Tax=Sugiyamaella lignohabitans TaxID=796027 RepID=A0A167CMV3_9ASCO|nr:uncharacterized protein AWJ20_126 [Sugiyamaella lignohabitans]ANB11899.1 hypothetical protein AWJ20_126 [Sugiyamaella lignohabitans]
MSKAANRLNGSIGPPSRNGSESPVSLPPMLSPTLPAWAEEMIPQRMLSPTLPPEFDDLGSFRSDSTGSSDKKKPSSAATASDRPVILQPVPKRAVAPLISEGNGDHILSNGKDSTINGKKRRPSFIVTLKVDTKERERDRDRDGELSDKSNSESAKNREKVNDRRIGEKTDRSKDRTVTKDGEIRAKERPEKGVASTKLNEKSKRPPVKDGRDSEGELSSKKPSSTNPNSSSKKTIGLGIIEHKSSQNGSSTSNNANTNATTNNTKPSTKRPKINRSYSSSSEDEGPLAESAKRKKISKNQNQNQNQNHNSQTQLPSVKATKQKSEQKDSGAGLTNPASSPISKISSQSAISEEKREKYYRLLRSKMHNWIELAREKKHEADSAMEKKQYSLAAVISVDSLLAFIVGFDYEDRADQMVRRDANRSSWSTLIPFIGRLIINFEQNKIHQLVGLLYQIRALVHMRIASACHSVIQKKTKQLPDTGSSASRAGSGPGSGSDDVDVNKLNQEIVHLTTKYMACHDSSMQDFKLGLTQLSLDDVEKDYPKTWTNRHASPKPSSKHEGGYRPLEDPYYLPMHCFSTLQEAAAFGYKLTKEWADSNNIKCDSWALVKGLC